MCVCVCVCVCAWQAAQAVLISLFQLNTPEFTMLLAALPKTFQDGATKLLQNHLRNTGNAAQVPHTAQRDTHTHTHTTQSLTLTHTLTSLGDTH